MSYRLETAPRNGPIFDVRYDPDILTRAQEYIGKDGTISFRIVHGATATLPPRFEAWLHDEHTPGGIQMAANAGSVETLIPIPVPQFTISMTSVSLVNFRVFFTQDASHLAALNPKLLLMRYRPARTMTPTPGIRRRKMSKRWVHPTHMNGAGASTGGSFDGGVHTNNAGAVIPPRPSEWPFSALTPYDDTSVDVDLSVWFSSNPSTLTANGVFQKGLGRSSLGSGALTFHTRQPFAFCVGIDNPDPVTAAKTPVIRGPMTEPFVMDLTANGKARIAHGTNIPAARHRAP